MTGWASLVIVPAFGLDTLVVAVGLGAAGVSERRRLALTVAASEGLMPIVGALAGAWLGRIASGYAVWGAAALLAFLGARELAEGWQEMGEADEGDDDRGEGARLGGGRLGGWALIAAALGVSVDELGAGLAAGAAGLPLRILAPALAVQAALFTYLGLQAGAAVRRVAGRYGELAAGVALIAVAAALVWLSWPAGGPALLGR